MIQILKNTGIALLLCLMVSCGGKQQPTVPSVTPTEKPPLIVPTDPPIHVPTATGLPFQFATPAMEGFFGDCWVPTGLTSQVSPNGQWTAAPCELGEASHLKIVNKGETSVWEPSFQEITGIPPCIAYNNQYGETRCFDGILYIHHWDKDSRYVLVEVNYLIDRAFEYSFGLYRLDVQTRQISPWLKVSPDYSYRFSFSPDNQNLAYVSSADAHTIYVNSIETGQVYSYKIPGQAHDVAYLVWSSDNQKIAFSVLHEGWFDDTGGFSLAVLDMRKEKVAVLISNDKRQFYPIDWASDTIIKLSNRTGLPDYQYDLGNNELEAVP